MIDRVFQLTREVRFAIDDAPVVSPDCSPQNGHAGHPSLDGLGHFFAIDITLVGDLEPQTSYVCNIKRIDDEVREIVVPFIAQSIANKTFTGNGATIVRRSFELLTNAWPSLLLAKLRLKLSPFLSLSLLATEYPMVRLSQTFEFSASHRLHNPSLSDAANREAFGKCNNIHGHGHNYVVEVTLAGLPDESGRLIDVPRFERIVNEAAIERLDHKHLNLEVKEFHDLNPSVENIAKVIYGLLKPALAGESSRLSSVTVWETPKTSCEYSESD